MLPIPPGWTLTDNALQKTFTFADYYRTMAFVNAVAYIAHGSNHHPDLTVGYNKCGVRFTTHDAGGVTAADHVAAAAVEALVSR